MSIKMYKTLIQVAAMLFAGLFLLGCPVDEKDIFNGDVKIINNTMSTIGYVNIHEASAAPGLNFGSLGSLLSITYSGYDCATSYVNTVEITENVSGKVNSASFIPPCGGTQTIQWDTV